MSTLSIRHHTTGETAKLVRDGCHTHPTWVHDQLGTEAESDLQHLLDQMSDYEFAARPNCPDACGIFMAADDADEYIRTRAADEADDLLNTIDTGWDDSQWSAIATHYVRLGLNEYDLGLLRHHMDGTDNVRASVVALLRRLSAL